MLHDDKKAPVPHKAEPHTNHPHPNLPPEERAAQQGLGANQTTDDGKPLPGPKKPHDNVTWVAFTKEGEEHIAWAMHKGTITRLEGNHSAIHAVQRAKVELEKQFPESYR